MSYTPPPPPEGGGGEGQSGAPQDPYGGQYGGGQEPPGQYPAGPGYGAPPPSGNNTKGVIALVVGIVGFVFAICCSLIGLVAGIVAVVLGRMAKNEIAATGGAQRGAGLAKAGFILGIVDIVLAVALIIVGILLSANGYDPFQLNTSP